MTNIRRVLLTHYPDAQWSISGNRYDTLDWYGPGAKPSLGELESWSEEEFSGPEYLFEEMRQARASAYRLEADPLFFKWQAGEGTEQEWLAKREEIRARYPYPEE